MRIEEHNGVYLIFAEAEEQFWAQWAFHPHDVKTSRPKLKRVLEEWWDATAPGQWTTSFTEKNSRAILIHDPKLFMLFKLRWADQPEIEGKIRIIEGASYVYAPYIPLAMTGRQAPAPIIDTHSGKEDPKT